MSVYSLNTKHSKIVVFWKELTLYKNDQILASLSKMKVFAEDNFSVAQMVQFFFDRVENIVGKGENAV